MSTRHKLYKLLAASLGVFVLIFLLVMGYVYSIFSREVPPDNALVNLPGLEKPVDVFIDSYGVPHVFGHSDEDLVRVQGYMIARDRLWQLDLVRRASGGTLSEVFGAAFYDYDVFQRVVGTRSTAEEKYKNALGEQTINLIQAYCDGINAYIDSAPPMPTIEFRIVGYKMEHFTPLDVVMIARNTGWTLSANWDNEILREAIAAERGEEAMWAIVPRHTDPGPFIIQPDQKSYKKTPAEHGRLYDGRPDTPVGREGRQYANSTRDKSVAPTIVKGLMDLHELYRTVRETSGRISSIPLASNSWVVSPKKTASGGAILCNDPHLELLLPSVWHESHLVGDNMDVSGVAFPGTPLIILGHTPHVAWGATVSVADSQDLYKIVTDDEHPDQYFYDGKWVPFKTAKEIIRVRTKEGHDERTFNVRSTVHGPIITDVADLGKNLPPMALRWTGYEETNEMEALLGMSKATDAASFLEAVKKMKVPPQNWVYADSEGHIGYIAAGLVPIRKKGDGTKPAPGDDPDYMWSGFIPSDELPQITDPPAGFIATANNKVVPEDYPYMFSQDYAPPYRAMRVVEMLSEGEKFTADDMARMQMDVKLKLGERLAPFFIQAHEKLAPKDDKRLAELADKLRQWDYSADVNSIAMTFFVESYRQAFFLTYEDEVSPDVYKVLRESGMAYTGFDNGIEAEFALFDDLRTENKAETRDEILVSAMRKAVEVLDEKLGASIKNWEWGNLHTITFNHPFASQAELLKKVLSRGPYPLPGSRDTVNNTSFHWWSNTYEVFHGPSLRHIVDYGDMDSTRFTISVGQSGHRLSRHYHDQVDDWLEGSYHNMPTSRADIEANAEGKLVFKPGLK